MGTRNGPLWIVGISLALMFLFAALLSEADDCSLSGLALEPSANIPGSCSFSQRIPLAAPTETLPLPRTSHNTELEAQQWMATSSIWMLIVTSLGVFFVGITVLQTRGLLENANETTRAANETLQQTLQLGSWKLRPYVHSAGLELVPTKHGGLQVFCKWFNHGATPTVNAVTTHYIAVTEELPGDDFAYENNLDHRAGRIAIGPDTLTKCIGPTVSSLDVARMREGRAHIIVYSFVEYSDQSGSGRRYRTEYCARIVDGKAYGNVWSFITHGPHNGWDDECLYVPQTSGSSITV